MTREIAIGPPPWVAERSRALHPDETLIAGIDADAASWHAPDSNDALGRLARAPGRLVAVLRGSDCRGGDAASLLGDLIPDAGEESITFLVPHGHRSLMMDRDAHEVRSFLCTPSFFQRHQARILGGGIPAYEAAQAAMTDAREVVVRARPWQPPSPAVAAAQPVLDAPVTWLVPHRGELGHLLACLAHLRRAVAPQDIVWVCLDEPAAPVHDDLVHQFPEIRFWRCSPAGVGPYVARHVLSRRATTDLLILQDSDDVPLEGRRAALVAAMRDGGWDMVGSHELRVDERLHEVIGLRFPADINAALQAVAPMVNEHVFLHPTTALRVAALHRAGGFSTVRSFAADTQFVLRSHFFLRSGNVDGFFYLRRKRYGSLTTSPGTGHGEAPREYLEAMWRRDFARVRAGELPLAQSSLMPEHHPALAEIRLEPLRPRHARRLPVATAAAAAQLPK